MKIYVDGSYNESLNLAGYAFAVVENEEIKFVQKEAMILRNGNSVTAELIGVIKALEYCQNQGIQEVTIIHDYNEIPMFAFSYRKTKNPSINSYVRKLREMRETIKVSFLKVKAHTDDRFNNYVDELSRKSIEEFLERLLKNKNNSKHSSENR